MVAMVARNPFTYDRMKASDESGLLCLDKSLAVQDAKEECDINTIVKRFGLTGQLPDNVRMPQYGDFTGIGDYKDALNAVIEAERSFMEMPADVRARFGNDPQQLLEFVNKEENREEAKKLGFLVPDKEPVKPIDVRVIADSPPK